MPVQKNLCRIVRGISVGTRRAETSDSGSLRTGAHRLNACPLGPMPRASLCRKELSRSGGSSLATVTDSGRRPTVFPDEEARNAESVRWATVSICLHVARGLFVPARHAPHEGTMSPSWAP